MRAAAHRGVYGPGDPEAQVAAVLAADRRTRAGRLRRRTFNGRSFDLNSAPLPDGGYVVCAVETTVAGRRPRRGRACADPDHHRAGDAAARAGRLRHRPAPCCSPIRASPNCSACRRSRSGAACGFPALLDLMAARDEFAGADGAAFIAAQRAMDRSRPATARRSPQQRPGDRRRLRSAAGWRLDHDGDRHQRRWSAPRTRPRAGPARWMRSSRPSRTASASMAPTTG